MKYVIVPMPAEKVKPALKKEASRNILIAANAWAFVDDKYVHGLLSVNDRQASLKYLQDYLEEDCEDFPLDIESFKEMVESLCREPLLFKHPRSWLLRVASLRLLKQD